MFFPRLRGPAKFAEFTKLSDSLLYLAPLHLDPQASFIAFEHSRKELST